MAEKWDAIIELGKCPETYRDFEGLSSTAEVVNLTRYMRHVFALNDYQCDVLANLINEYRDEGDGDNPEAEVLHMMAHCVRELTSVTMWVKSEIPWS